MSIATFIGRLLGGFVAGAAQRLLRADAAEPVRAPLEPPPPIGPDGASQYLRGVQAERDRQQQRDRGAEAAKRMDEQLSDEGEG